MLPRTSLVAVHSQMAHFRQILQPFLQEALLPDLGPN